MDRLWAPWRLAYVTAAPAPSTDCIFCDALTSADAELTVFRARHAFVILNLYPYNNGHLMVVPNRHLNTLALLTPDEQQELMSLTRLSEMALSEAYRPQGLNVGINLGRAAGAGIENHLHIHVVPRWQGDTNFMTAVGETRVLPEDLRQTASNLRPVFERLARSGA
ncbi:MAG: HIT domain-containing protein [Vicinamibacterales bacterium]|nr:HIT domain-containing protein [Vicinamibacterales bacterium]